MEILVNKLSGSTIFDPYHFSNFTRLWFRFRT